MAKTNEGFIFMKTKPSVLVLKADGINCDEELAHAFNLAGGNVQTVHVNELRRRDKKLNDFQILAIPGGFSYGDDIIAGKVLAVELTSFFSDQLQKFVNRKNTLVIGICNGFQVLVRTGLLPFGNVGVMSATLNDNLSGHFECRWVDCKIENNTSCVFLQNLKNENVTYQVAHGEGMFYADAKTLDKIEKKNLVALRYIDDKGNQTMNYPANPNGALHAIAGITDPTGRILGLMPHPERFVTEEQHPNWLRKPIKPQGLPIFQNMISYAKEV
ncbi:MAG: phosphoribosylformylglycinamidine synthase I [Patescibacteria group bacterium]